MPIVIEKNEPMRKKYSLAQYQKGNPKMNLLRMERRLLILALKRANWKIKKAFKLNFDNPTITINGYWCMIYRHHISIENKTFKKLTEIN